MSTNALGSLNAIHNVEANQERRDTGTTSNVDPFDIELQHAYLAYYHALAQPSHAAQNLQVRPRTAFEDVTDAT